jgi:homoserine kinase type II
MSDDTISYASTVLAARYGIHAPDLIRLPIGQGTVNYRASTPGGTFFVKTYPSGTGLDGEREAVKLTMLARSHGIPSAAIVPARDGDLIDTSSPVPLSVWEWMPGQVTPRLSLSQLQEAGHALGRIHVTFAPLPQSADLAPRTASWRQFDLPSMTARIDQLLAVIEDRTTAGRADAFDDIACQTLTERKSMLPVIPQLLAGLPGELTAQVLHGDFSPVNLLFETGTLTAVLDFRPPEPFLIAYDLGRMAFYPHTVTADGWLEAAASLITAYQSAGPAAAGADIRYCGQVALLQLLRSLYGVKEHYLKPGLFQHDLDDFWLLRHRAARILLDHLPEVDTLLADLAVTARR